MWEEKNAVTLKVCISLIRKQRDTISNAELYKECLCALKQETQKGLILHTFFFFFQKKDVILPFVTDRFERMASVLRFVFKYLYCMGDLKTPVC